MIKLLELKQIITNVYWNPEVYYMQKIKSTAIRKADYKDLQQKYENPIQHACDIQEGQVFIANGWQRPEGMCESAWESILNCAI